MTIQRLCIVLLVALTAGALPLGCSTGRSPAGQTEVNPDSSGTQKVRRVSLGMQKAGVRENLGDPRQIEGGNEHMRWTYHFRVRCDYQEDCFYRTVETTLVFKDGYLDQVYDAPGFLIIERRNVR